MNCVMKIVREVSFTHIACDFFLNNEIKSLKQLANYETKHNALTAIHNGLTTQHNALRAIHNGLTTKHNALTKRHNGLKLGPSALTTKYNTFTMH